MKEEILDKIEKVKKYLLVIEEIKNFTDKTRFQRNINQMLCESPYERMKKLLECYLTDLRNKLCELEGN